MNNYLPCTIFNIHSLLQLYYLSLLSLFLTEFYPQSSNTILLSKVDSFALYPQTVIFLCAFFKYMWGLSFVDNILFHADTQYN